IPPAIEPLTTTRFSVAGDQLGDAFVEQGLGTALEELPWLPRRQFIPRESGELMELRVDAQPASIEIEMRDADRRLVEGCLEPKFRGGGLSLLRDFPQHCVQPLSLPGEGGHRCC